MMIVADTCWATELFSFLLFLRKTMTAGSTSRNTGEEKICQVIRTTRFSGSTNGWRDCPTMTSIGVWWGIVKAPSSAGRRGSEPLFGTSTGCVCLSYFEIPTEFEPCLCSYFEVSVLSLCLSYVLNVLVVYSCPSTSYWFIKNFVWNFKNMTVPKCSILIHIYKHMH